MSVENRDGGAYTVEDMKRMSHKTKYYDEENAAQIELMQGKATEICAGCQRDGKSYPTQ